MLESPEDLKLPAGERLIDSSESDQTVPLPSGTSPTEEHLTPDISSQEKETFSREAFLQKLNEVGIKPTLPPLLRTANMRFGEGILTIETSQFARSKFEDSLTKSLLLSALESFGGHEVRFQVEMPVEKIEDAASMAEEIFG